MPTLLQRVVELWSAFDRRALLSVATPPGLTPPLLFDHGSGLLYDVERDLTWLQDVNYAKTSGRSPTGQLTWDQARAWVARLNYRGITGWRLPTSLNPDGTGPCVGEGCRDSELGHLLLTARLRPAPGLHAVNWQSFAIFWSSTEASATEAFAFRLLSLKQGRLAKDPWTPQADLGGVPPSDALLTWPVHDGAVYPSLFRRLLSALLIRDRVSPGSSTRFAEMERPPYSDRSP